MRSLHYSTRAPSGVSLPKQALLVRSLYGTRVAKRPIAATAPSDGVSITLKGPEPPTKISDYIAGPYGSGRVSVDSQGALKPYSGFFTVDTVLMATCGEDADDILEVPNLRHLLTPR